MKTLTQEQKKEYVKHHGVNCPFCGSNDLNSGVVQVDENGAWQEVTCLDCGEGWLDRYALVGIEYGRS